MTIRHIVSWKLASEDAGLRRQQAASIKERLEGLAPLIPEILAIEVHADLGHIDGNFDVVLVSDFADEQALDTYTNHPAHQVVVTYVRTVVSARVAVDYEV
jgi:hypothetical protein